MVGPLPIINAPAHELETLLTIIQKCKAMTKLRNGSYTVVTMDELGLCNKAIMLQWADGDVQGRTYYNWWLPYTDERLKSDWQICAIIRNFRHVGGKRSFWRNHS